MYVFNLIFNLFGIFFSNNPSNKILATPLMYNILFIVPLKPSAVKKWESYEANGFIFVWYHAENENPSWYPPRDEAIGKWTYRGRSEHYVNVHIQDIPENGADVSHLTALHGDMALGGQYAAQANRSVWNILGRHKWKATWKVDENQRHASVLELEHKLEVFQKFIIFGMDVKAHQVMHRLHSIRVFKLDVA